FKQVNSYSSLTEDTKHTEESSTTDSTSTMTETTSTTDTTATTDSINDTTETGDSNLVDNQSTINEVSSENKKTMLAERDNHKQQTQVSKNNSVLPKTNENTRLVIVYMIIGMTIVSSCSLFVFKKIRND
ncbi:LPXTG cell wall anchor domain-containing protein, partial [Vagococcus penaei]